MMFKSKQILGIILLLGILFNVYNVNNIQILADENTKSVLLLYEERNFFGDKRDSVSALEDLLGHYKVAVTLEKLSKQEKYNFDKYDLVFVVALDNDINYPNLISALKSYKNRLIWLGNGIEFFLKETQYGILYEGEYSDITSVSYQRSGTGEEKTFNIGPKRTFYNVKSSAKDNKIYATLSDGLNEFPFIIESDNLTYISRVDINEPLFYIFADYLNRILEKKFYKEDRLLISIEDVHIFSDYENLKRLSDILYLENIEFTVGLIPYIRQEDLKYITEFTESPKFIETLKYMQDKGGAVVLHTYVHRITENEITISRDDTKSLENLKTYFDIAVKDCVDNGIIPIGYETSHAYLSKREFRVLKEIFSTAYGQLFINEGNYIVFPFELYNTENFNKFFPINLGYVENKLGNEFEMIDIWFNRISLVEGFYGGIYFHSSTKPQYLEELINIIKEKGISTASPLNETHFVKTSNYNILIKDGKALVEKTELEQQNKKARDIQDKLFKVVGSILTISVILFAYILRKTIKFQRKNMFKG